jgi:hypothetical protein
MKPDPSVENTQEYVNVEAVVGGAAGVIMGRRRYLRECEAAAEQDPGHDAK